MPAEITVARQEQVHRDRRQRLIGVRTEEPATYRRRIAPPPQHPVVSSVEGALAVFTTIWVFLYFPLATYLVVKGTQSLWLSYVFSYLADLTGMALLISGVAALWRVRPFAGPLTAAGWAWTAATLWRSTVERHLASGQGRPMAPGPVALWLGPVLTVIALSAIGVSFWVIVRRDADARS